MPSFRIVAAGLLGALSLIAAAAPASACPERGADRAIGRVRAQVAWDVRQLQHDQRDYRGDKERGVVELQRARNELLAAVQYDDREPSGGYSGVAVDLPGERDQGRSDGNIRRVRRAIEGQIGELERIDGGRFGGHKGAAIASLRGARRDLLAAERYATAFGY